ncbi:hypothetical protein IFM89_008053 [Coptis chinensis]|uniref:Uncharacterized protein n=1 Tax=Coptis chinensis TaxID=261450 RepID=A0A835M9C1_9MAGN|nr:hypothetical protein IFM89_008053 [Coptis chinensis]
MVLHMVVHQGTAHGDQENSNNTSLQQDAIKRNNAVRSTPPCSGGTQHVEISELHKDWGSTSNRWADMAEENLPLDKGDNTAKKRGYMPQWKLQKVSPPKTRLQPGGKSENKVEGLLEQEESFWRQKSKVKWDNDLDKSTKFFHALSDMNRNKSYISELRNTEGVILTDQKEIGDFMPWGGFKSAAAPESAQRRHKSMASIHQWLVLDYSNDEDKIEEELEEEKTNEEEECNDEWLRDPYCYYYVKDGNGSSTTCDDDEDDCEDGDAEDEDEDEDEDDDDNDNDEDDD